MKDKAYNSFAIPGWLQSKCCYQQSYIYGIPPKCKMLFPLYDWTNKVILYYTGAYSATTETVLIILLVAAKY